MTRREIVEEMLSCPTQWSVEYILRSKKYSGRHVLRGSIIVEAVNGFCARAEARLQLEEAYPWMRVHYLCPTQLEAEDIMVIEPDSRACSACGSDLAPGAGCDVCGELFEEEEA
jgi:hypothetical protein